MKLIIYLRLQKLWWVFYCTNDNESILSNLPVLHNQKFSKRFTIISYFIFNGRYICRVK